MHSWRDYVSAANWAETVKREPNVCGAKSKYCEQNRKSDCIKIMMKIKWEYIRYRWWNYLPSAIQKVWMSAFIFHFRCDDPINNRATLNNAYRSTDCKLISHLWIHTHRTRWHFAHVRYLAFQIGLPQLLHYYSWSTEFSVFRIVCKKREKNSSMRLFHHMAFKGISTDLLRSRYRVINCLASIWLSSIRLCAYCNHFNYLHRRKWNFPLWLSH